MSIKNHSDLNSEITSNITNNGSQAITGLILQGDLLDMADSAVNILGDTVQGKLSYSSLFTISSNGDIVHKKYVDDSISTLSSSTVPTSRSLNINGVSLDLSSNRSWRTGQASTGAYTYAGISVASTTQVNIGACTGVIVDNETTPNSPSYIEVNYAGEINKTVTTLGSGIATYVLLNSSGVIVFQNTFPTAAERKTMIYLSKIGHPTGSINTAGNEVDYVLSPISQLRDLFQAIKYVNNGVVPSANGANLNINTSSGTVTGDGINFVTDRTNPNTLSVSAGTPISFLPRTQTGAGGGSISTVDVGNYDVAGTVTAIPGGANTSTLQYIYLVPGLGYIIQYGQTTYASLTDAIAAVGRETFTIYPSLSRNAILIGVLAVIKSATALNNIAQARFFQASQFGEIGGSSAGISTSTLQTAYTNSTQPQILTDTTRLAFQIKRGSSLDTNNIFEGLNGAGTTTFSLNGNGAVSILGTGGNGYQEFNAQSSNTGASANTSFRLFSGSTGNFSWVRKNGADTFVRSFDSTLTADRTWSFQDASYQIAGTNIAQSFSANQTFLDSKLLLRNPANTFSYTIAPSAIVADRTLTIPLLAGNDTIAVLGTEQTFTAQQTFNSNIKFASAGLIKDSNGNNLIAFPATIASVVNYLEIDNAATTGNPTIKSVGADASIGMDFQMTGSASSFRFKLGSGSTIISFGNNIISTNDSVNFAFGTSTGTKHGTATTQKQSFWNATPVIQPTTAITGSAITANTGTAVNDASTFAGYTIGQVVAALRQIGLLA